MSDFAKNIQIILTNEGSAWQGKPSDRGNYFKGVLVGSKYGITGWDVYKHFGIDVTIDTMQNLTVEQATEIYKEDYWDPMLGDQISNDSVCGIIFDAVVNEGMYAGIVGVQKIVGTEEDGVMGNITLTALNTYDQESLFNQYKQYRADQYLRISKEKNNAEFYNDWMTRLNSFVFIAS